MKRIDELARPIIAAITIVAGLSIAFALPAAGAHVEKAPIFSTAVTLTDGHGHAAPGAEPSIAIDTTSRAGVNKLYIVSPNLHSLWRSANGGKSWSAPVVFDASGTAPGGDSDVAVTKQGHVVVDDLNITHAWVQVSTNHGKSFNSGTATAFEDDRPWLATEGLNNVYVGYHDFAAEIPVICTSTDGGRTFLLCSQTFSDPTGVAQCAENTIPARPIVVDPSDGSVNFMYSCSTAAENVAEPPYGPLHDYYLAKASPTLASGLTYQTYLIFMADTSGGKAPNYANIFGTMAVDGAGDYYALIDGTADHNNVKANPYHVYLLTSTNHGKTWSKPKQVDHDTNSAGTHVLADLAVTRKGNVDVVWYGSTATGDPNGECGTVASQSPCANDPFYTAKSGKGPAWKVYLAQTDEGLATKPKWTQTVVNRKVTHYGEICTNGIVCGSSDRSLLDFISVAVDCHGKAHVTYASNPKEATGQAAYLQVSNQTGGDRLTPLQSCAALTSGGGT